jgi:CheY-like chemotaxis protein
MPAENIERPIRILYVEDDQNISATISQMLKLLGYEIMCANNGEQGVEAAESWNPDIILMDLRMPVMDGPTAIRILRSNPNTSAIPIFVLSAYKDAKTREICRQIGADKFLSKPIDIEQVDTVIKEALRQQDQEKVKSATEPSPDNGLIHDAS